MFLKLAFMMICISHLTSVCADDVDQTKEKEEFRIFDDTTPEGNKQFYRDNHAQQTVDFVLSKEQQCVPLRTQKMGIWDAMRVLDTLVDASDPDLSVSQSFHAFQTAEALRRDGQPRWLILTGLIHDLGKVLTLYGEPQWAVVGDTFPVGCAWSDKIVFPQYFEANPDRNIAAYQTQEGIYSVGCGLRNVHMSWGHDEYLYHVVKNYLPEEAGYIIRYHSFYPWHDQGAYEYLLDAKDRDMLCWIKLFNKYDLYSKSNEPFDLEAQMPFYKELVSEFFPDVLDW